MFAKVPAAAAVAGMAMLLCYATVGGQMGKVSLASPRVQHPHELAQALQDTSSVLAMSTYSYHDTVTGRLQHE